MTKNRSRPRLILAVLLACLGIVSGCARHEFTGTVFEDASPAQPIVGQRADGSDFALANLRGRPVLLFFGYTFCPDICPLTLTELAAAQNLLADSAPQAAQELQIVFVSVDPQRDNLERLQAYVQAFESNDSALWGVRVPAPALEEIKPAYGLYAEAAGDASGNPSQDAYLVDHTSGVYFIDANGNWQALFRADITAAELAADLKVLLR